MSDHSSFPKSSKASSVSGLRRTVHPGFMSASLSPVRRRPGLHASSHQRQEVCFEFCFDDVVFHFFFSVSCSSLLNLQMTRCKHTGLMSLLPTKCSIRLTLSRAKGLPGGTTPGLLRTSNLFFSQGSRRFQKLAGYSGLSPLSPMRAPKV